MLLGDAGHAIGDKPQQPAEEKGDDCNYNQMWQLCADEFLAVDDPLVQHFAKEPAFLEPAPPHHNRKVRRNERWKHAKTPPTRLDCAQERPEPGPAFRSASCQMQRSTQQERRSGAMTSASRFS